MRGDYLVVSEKTSRLDVDHRLPLRIYFRAADSILRQARIYRKENNLIDLYVLLLRFSSLVMETIPQHREYRAFLGKEKSDFRKRLYDVMNELEMLKPLVRKEISRYNSAYLPSEPTSHGFSSSTRIISGPQIEKRLFFSGVSVGKEFSTGAIDSELDAANKQLFTQVGYNSGGDVGSSSPTDSRKPEYSCAISNWNGGLSIQPVQSVRKQHLQVDYNLTGNMVDRPIDYSQLSHGLSRGGSSRSFRIPIPTSESLLRHSFLVSDQKVASVPNVTTKVRYPSLIDLPSTVIPSLNQSSGLTSSMKSAPSTSSQKSVAKPMFYDEADMLKFEERHSSLVDSAVSLQSQLNKQPFPPPVAAEVQSVPVIPRSCENGCTGGLPYDLSSPPAGPLGLSEDSLQSRKPKQLHISVRLMDEFMSVANGNTKINLETCGVLAGSLKEGIFYVTTLIVPKQESTSNSCSTINEEDIFEYQDKHELFQFGWIHTHPSQSCFMSSIDLHTHYSYQVMLPEAIAIVMAPTDSSRKYGIFRLAEPGGIKIIQACDKRGFHPHNEPLGGIYEQCAHVLLDPKLMCDVVDLR